MTTPKATANTANTAPMRFYFVDEAGDGTLFDGKGQVIVGQPGCSRFFMLGETADDETA